MRKISLWQMTTGIDAGRWEWRVLWIYPDPNKNDEVLAWGSSSTAQFALEAAIREFND